MPCRSTPEMLACEQCSLHLTRGRVVPGHGNPDADIAFVAEAPGVEEDRVGEPLVGPAGKRFNRQLVVAGLTRDMVWLDNTVHCHPPENQLRAYPDAQLRCPPLWLLPVLQQVKPRVIVALGRTAGALWMPGLDAHAIAELARHTGEYLVVGALHPSYARWLRGDWNEADDSIVLSIQRAVELLATWRLEPEFATGRDKAALPAQ